MKAIAYLLVVLFVLIFALGGWLLAVEWLQAPHYVEYVLRQIGGGVMIVALLKISKGMPR